MYTKIPNAFAFGIFETVLNKGKACLLEFTNPTHDFAKSPIQRAFQFSLGVPELVPDGNMLGAMLFALAAADAVGGGGGVFAQHGAHHVIPEALECALLIFAVIGGKGAGDVHIMGAGHTVAAAGTANLHFGVDGLHHLPEHLLIGPSQLPDPGGGGGLDVVAHHFHGVHAGQNYCDLRLIPQPPESPLGRGVLHGIVRKDLFCPLRQETHQLSAPEGFHDHHGDPFVVGIVQPPAAGLRVLVHIVVLDLAEVPVPGIDLSLIHI